MSRQFYDCADHCFTHHHFSRSHGYPFRKNPGWKRNERIKANQALNRFVYSASHDLRSPLTSLAGLIELSKRDNAGREEYLKLMRHQVHVMDKLIHDIIDYSRN